MNVLMLSTDRNAFAEGSAVRARFREFGALCGTLHIIVRAKGEHRSEAIAENVFLHPTNSRSRWRSLFDTLEIGRHLPRPDLITAQDPFETGFIGWRLSRFHRAKLELQLHTDFLSPYFARHSFLNRLRVMLARFLLPKADGIRVVSERIKNSLQTKNYKLKTTPVVLPIFVDARGIMLKKPLFDLHRRYPQFDFIVLTVARLEAEKGLFTALQAVREVIKGYPRTGFVVVGEGKERQPLKRAAAAFGIGENVRFEGRQEDVVSYYKTADLYLCSSLYEGYGLALAEAALSGVPIVTTDVGLAGDVLKEGRGASICPVNDAHCLARAITRLIGDAESRRELARTARAEALRNLPPDKPAYLSRYKEAWENSLASAL